MRSAIVTGLASAGFGIGGWAMPVAFPQVNPLLGKAMLAVAVTLLVVAVILRIWDEPRKVAIEAIAEANFSQNHSGVGHNIVAENVSFGREKFAVTEHLINEIAAKLDPLRAVCLVWRNRGKGNQHAAAVEAGLLARGFTIGGKMGFGEITGVEFDEPIVISPIGFTINGMTIMGGQQTVAIEPGAYNEN